MRAIVSFAISICLACNVPRSSGPVQLVADIQDLPDGRVFLYHSGRQTAIDSVISSKGHFVFNMPCDSSFAPFEISIRYPDTTREGLTYRRLLGFENPFAKLVMSSVYVDRGTAKIAGRKTATGIICRFSGNRQNDVFYKMPDNPFRYSLAGDPQKKNSALSHDRELIAKYSYSFFLLDKLDQVREHFTDSELKILLACFDPQVAQSLPYKDFQHYFEVKSNAGSELINLKLDNDKNEALPVLDKKGRMNFIVFWASWCGPCRQEIPDLKRLYARYNEQLNFTSISIDENKTKWVDALAKENMPWPQFVTNSSTLKTVNALFNIRGVPLMVIIDKNGNSLKQFGNELSLYQLDSLLSATLQVPLAIPWRRVDTLPFPAIN